MRQPPNVSEYYKMVWEIVKQIPRGIVATYGQIATMIPVPDGVEPPVYDKLSPQWVGSAMHATPENGGIPWQRVINSMGKISFPEGSKQALLQRELLEAEGVIFDEKNKVDFNEVGWDGPDDDWLNEHGFYAPRPLRKKPKSGQTSLF
ncbi:MAG: MGMT family protein [Anaerolineae bacterium]|nr:MGMT family protein [Anaerolineae bacterium]